MLIATNKGVAMVLHGRTRTLLPLFVAIVLSCLMLIPELHAHKTLIAVLLLLFLVLALVGAVRARKDHPDPAP